MEGNAQPAGAISTEDRALGIGADDVALFNVPCECGETYFPAFPLALLAGGEQPVGGERRWIVGEHTRLDHLRVGLRELSDIPTN